MLKIKVNGPVRRCSYILPSEHAFIQGPSILVLKWLYLPVSAALTKYTFGFTSD